jgi:drug/metabolite transporter (DMT)-like permease
LKPLLADRRMTVLAFVLLVVFWSSSFAAVKIGLEYTPPLLFAGVRSILGGTAITLAALVWGGDPNFGRDWKVFALLAVFNVAAFIGFQTYAVMYLPSGTAAVLIYLQPILVGFLAWMALGESLGVVKLVGLLLGFAGIVAVSSGGFSGAAGGEVTPIGVTFGVASAIFWALGTVLFKRYEARVSTLWAVAVPFLAGGIALTVLGLAVESPAEISSSGTFVAALLYSALVGTGFAWLLFFGLVRAGEASRVAAYIFFVPLVAVLIGALFLGEALRASLIVGAVLVVSGIYLVNRQPAVSGQPSAKSKDSQAGG